ncbi:polysaccharide biosynthesis C-terminal domain-containing protein [Flavisolibacter sp. BT320]|nr:polysaccharide biosynthesis C-terminal domain-containing protein [Flavisolibacter longurius]
MEAKQFFKSLSWLLFLNLLIKPAWVFLIDRRVQNLVGHEVYGTYFALFNFTYIFLFLADAGLTTMLTQRLSADRSGNVQQLLRLKLLLLVLYAVCCSGVALLTGISNWTIFFYLVVIQSLTSFFIFLRGVLTAAQLFKSDAYFSVLDKSLLILLCLGPVYGFFKPITILLFLQLQTLSMAVAVGSLLFFLWQKKKITGGEKVGLPLIAKRVLPFVALVLLMATHNRLDAFLLVQLHPDGARQAGIYAMAFRLLDAGNMLGYLTASFLLPFLARNRQDGALVQKVVLFSRHGLLLLSVLTLAFVFVHTTWLQEVLYHSSEEYNNKVFVLTIAALPAYYLVHVYGTVLTAIGAFGPFIRILLVAVAGNVALNLWLIPQYGALGSCLAALLSQYSCGVWLWYCASQKQNISIAASSAALYPLAALIFGGLLYAGKMFTDNVGITLAILVVAGGALFLAGYSKLKKRVLPFLNKLHA